VGDIFSIMSSSLVSLFICLAVGYICRKKHILSREITGGLSSLLIMVTLPCTIFISFQREFSSELLIESVWVFIISVITNFFAMFMGWVFTRLFKKLTIDQKRLWIFALTFSNTGYMGLPVINAIYGAEGLIFCAMVSAAFNFMAYTVGIRIISKEKKKMDWRAIVFNPPLIASVIAIICFVLSAVPPAPVNNGIKFLSDMTTPLAMLIIGSMLAKSDITRVFTDKLLYIPMAARLIVLPLIALYVLKPFVTNPVMLGVCVILTGMPVATITPIFAERYGSDTDYASKIVFATTVLCLATTPLISLLL
jgi:predicted permease